jgi:PAS domain S-box-containing protein
MTDDNVRKQPARDKNDKKNADKLTESLKEKQKRFDFAEKIAHSGSLEWYIKTARMIWSDELFRILGFEPGSFKPTYQKFTGSIHPRDSKRVLDSVQETFREHVPFSTEFRIVKPDKTVRDVHMMGEIYRDAQGQPLKMNGSVQDITERKLMEKKLAEQNEELLKFTAALDGMDDLVIMTDNTGFIDYINRACEKTLGYPPEKIKRRHISEFKDPESGFELGKEVFIDDPKSVWTGNLNLVNKHGMTVRTSLKSTPIMKENYSICRVFVLWVQF